MDVKNPHNNFVEYVFSQPEEAKSLLENYLPDSIAEHIDFSSLEVLKDTFIDEDLKDYYSDLIFRVNFADTKGYLYLIFDHKSSVDKKIHLQLINYVHQFWNKKCLENSKWQKLTPIITMVLYHGQYSWTRPTRLRDVIDTELEDLLKYTLDYEYILVDLSKYSDEEIKGTLITQTALVILKHIFDNNLGWNDLLLKLEELLFLLRDNANVLDFLRAILTYIFSAKTVASDSMKEIVEKSIGFKGKEVFMTVKEQWIQEGEIKGRKEGEIKGEIKGIKGEIAMLDQLYKKGKLTEQEYQEMLLPLKQKLDNLNKELKE